MGGVVLVGWLPIASHPPAPAPRVCRHPLGVVVHHCAFWIYQECLAAGIARRAEAAMRADGSGQFAFLIGQQRKRQFERVGEFLV